MGFSALDGSKSWSLTRYLFFEKDKEPATSTVQFSDYKDIDGFKYPSKLTMDINGNPMEINVSKMELNCKIKKSEFIWED